MQACEDVGLQGIGAGAEISRYLGVDYSASVAVSGLRLTRRKRWVKAKGKVKKARQLRKAAGEVGVAWAAGPGAAVRWGSEVYGVNGSVLEANRKITGAAVLPGGACAEV